MGFYFYFLERSVFGSRVRGKVVVRPVHVLQCGVEGAHAVVELPRALHFFFGIVFVFLDDIGHFIERLREHFGELTREPGHGDGG